MLMTNIPAKITFSGPQETGSSIDRKSASEQSENVVAFVLFPNPSHNEVFISWRVNIFSWFIHFLRSNFTPISSHFPRFSTSLLS